MTLDTVEEKMLPSNATAAESSKSVASAAATNPNKELSSTTPLTLSSLLLTESTKIVSAVLSSNPFPAGYHPMGYKLTKLGKIFLEFRGSNASDVGLFLLTVKDNRRTLQSLKHEWRTIVRITKGGDHMRILRKLPEIVQFCLSAGLVD